MKWLVRLVVGLLRGEARGRVVSYSPLSFNVVDKDSIKKFIYEWNTNYPIDRWWREKHNIAFNSSSHREVSFMDMRLEWEEDQLYNKLRNEEVYKINSGDFFKKVERVDVPLTEEEQLQKFLEEEKDMDYSQYDDKAVEKKNK
jgi:translation elongation factor P/translation initiation factor 5A